MRVSTAEQADSGAGMAAQRSAIEAEADRRGWLTVEYVEDAAKSGKDLERPAMQRVLDMLARGEADCLVAAKVDRISRSVRDYSGLLERARREGWALVTLDLGLDTTTPLGEAMANVSATFAQLERRMIGQRTRDGLAAKRAAGVRIGRPVTLSEETRAKIGNLRDGGMSPERIADVLQAEGVATARGGARWYPSTVRRVLSSLANEAELTEIRAGL
jgi:DNA invertase Pin-like site-specific DNA recombinase